MRKYKNNIILSVRNITLNKEILISYFKNIILSFKIITSSLIILMLSLVNIINTSALSYGSNIGVGFTFNPTISISLSPSDLVIDNLVPGSTEDSNSINVSVATNAAYGYTLSANASSNDLIHNNNIGAFSSIATNANLASLTSDNTWGYSISLDSGSSWSNYSGLSTEVNKTLYETTNTADSNSVDFRIGAKASSIQPSGIYTGTINFTVVTKPKPITLAEAYKSEGKELYHGYYTMQDMTHTICEKTEDIGAQLQVIDIRDDKVYWISKLADDNCWMTQNLELDLVANSTILNSTNTDINVESYNPDSGAYSPAGGYSKDNITGIITWSPERSTVASMGKNDFPIIVNMPLSHNPGEKYYYTSGVTTNDIVYNSIAECMNANHVDCSHYSAGNYYSWTAVAASNDTSTTTNANNSICPKGWSLPKMSNFSILGSMYNISNDTALDLRNSPLYFVRPGYTYDNDESYGSSIGFYWSNTKGRYLRFNTNYYNPSLSNSEYFGFSVRCLAR